MLNEFDVVSLKLDLPDNALVRGMRGTVVHVHHLPNLAYEVEFCNGEGETIAMLPLLEDQISLEWPASEPRKAA